jgi:hypothetical protein
MPRPKSRVRYSATTGLAPARLSPRAVPTVDPWTAGEMFVSPHVEERRRGLALLCGSEAARTSTLTPHLLASRLEEPDLALRAQIVQALADYFEIRGREFRYPPEVRSAVAAHIRRFDRPQVLALLELRAAAQAGRVALPPDGLRRLFERLPDASALLTRLAGDRELAVHLRAAAIEMIGHVGFTDAWAALEGLALRLEGRRAGQVPMLFAPSDRAGEEELLPALKQTLRLLEEDQ